MDWLMVQTHSQNSRTYISNLAANKQRCWTGLVLSHLVRVFWLVQSVPQQSQDMSSSLLEAARLGDTARCAELLDSGTDVETANIVRLYGRVRRLRLRFSSLLLVMKYCSIHYTLVLLNLRPGRFAVGARCVCDMESNHI